MVNFQISKILNGYLQDIFIYSVISLFVYVQVKLHQHQVLLHVWEYTCSRVEVFDLWTQQGIKPMTSKNQKFRHISDQKTRTQSPHSYQ